MQAFKLFAVGAIARGPSINGCERDRLKRGDADVSVAVQIPETLPDRPEMAFNLRLFLQGLGNMPAFGDIGEEVGVTSPLQAPKQACNQFFASVSRLSAWLE